MSEKGNARDKDARIAEREQLEAEVQRSLSVAKMKQAHKLIEDAEKSRKLSNVLSLCNRIELLASFLKGYTENWLGSSVLRKFPFASLDNPAGKLLVKETQFYARTYASIRYDLQEIFDIKSEEIDRLFPELQVQTENLSMLISSTSNIYIQLNDMRCYCSRNIV